MIRRIALFVCVSSLSLLAGCAAETAEDELDPQQLEAALLDDDVDTDAVTDSAEAASTDGSGIAVAMPGAPPRLGPNPNGVPRLNVAGDPRPLPWADSRDNFVGPAVNGNNDER